MCRDAPAYRIILVTEHICQITGLPHRSWVSFVIVVRYRAYVPMHYMRYPLVCEDNWSRYLLAAGARDASAREQFGRAGACVMSRGHLSISRTHSRILHIYARTTHFRENAAGEWKWCYDTVHAAPWTAHWIFRQFAHIYLSLSLPVRVHIVCVASSHVSAYSQMRSRAFALTETSLSIQANGRWTLHARGLARRQSRRERRQTENRARGRHKA